jgi:hypothetical protein
MKIIQKAAALSTLSLSLSLIVTAGGYYLLRLRYTPLRVAPSVESLRMFVVVVPVRVRQRTDGVARHRMVPM